MNEQELVNHITSLEARMNRMEKLMHQLLAIQTASGAQIDKTMQIQNMLQELSNGPTSHAPMNNPAMATQQERPEIAAIRQALLAGNKMKAIQLYRGLYGVGLKEAQAALDAM